MTMYVFGQIVIKRENFNQGYKLSFFDSFLNESSHALSQLQALL